MEVIDTEIGTLDIIENTFKFLLECKENGDVQGKQSPPSIYMVPSVIRDLNPSSFNPKVVSIGPLHKQDGNLQRFEVQKATYLHNLLTRYGCLSDQTLRECSEKVIHSIERIKACYAGSTSYNDFELAKMMVIDSCFILEFTASLSDLSSESNLLITRNIIYDLLLIENQIPFFVLENIFECTILASGQMVEGASLTTHIEVLLNYYYFFEGNLVVPHASTHDHILGFVHEYHQPAVPPRQSVFTSIPRGHSAMELHRAGMKFKPNEDQNWALAMKLELPLPLFSWFPIFMVIPQLFWLPWPTLKMPKVSIGDSTELIFRNLMIYEQISDVKTYVTSYICAMDMLIDTPQDVAMLVKSKVLTSYFGSNEDAANMINKLTKDIMFPEFFYDRQWEEMDAYYNSYWPNTVAGLKRTYFNNPWSIIALFAAFVLFVLTVVQTIFTIKAANGTGVTK